MQQSAFCILLHCVDLTSRSAFLATDIAHGRQKCGKQSEICFPRLEWFHREQRHIHSFLNVGPCTLLQFRNLLYADGRTSWTGDQSVASSYLRGGQHKHRINARTDIHVLSGIRTHYLRVRASEGSSCLRPLGHPDWHIGI
jgi:hypothetical protein